MHCLYKITNLVNNKIYIGQTNNLNRRWQAHKNAALKNKPEQIIHFALIKYGLENFQFEHIATCKTWDDANEVETILVIQENSLSPNGYNVTRGGYNAPKTDEWKQAMKNWHASLSFEEREEISKKQSEATLKQISEKGHPAQGRIVTQETRELHRKIRLENPIEYTEEIRQHMSKAHLGIKDTEVTKQKKSESAKEAWTKRANYDGIKCHAPGCDIEGKHKYKIINDIRYCNKHGLRMLRRGSL